MLFGDSVFGVESGGRCRSRSLCGDCGFFFRVFFAVSFVMFGGVCMGRGALLKEEGVIGGESIS